MIYRIFSPFYYKGKVKNHDRMRSELAPHIEESYNKNPNNQPKSWSCKVHTSYLETDEKLEEIKQMYYENIVEFLQEINFPKCRIDIERAWFNVYREGQWQEVHNHFGGKDGTYFSAVHFLKYNKTKHTSLVFNNTNSTLLQPFTLGRESHIDYWDIKHPLNIEEGDIIIFPSTLDHQVYPQETNESRITISFNVRALPSSDI